MNQSTSTTPIVFTGTGREYFGIWIVNLLLSLLTLGIYSAWAKIRRKKYFYNNMLINQAGFDYHANPISILKGRAIAFAFFLVYAMGDRLHMAVPAVMLIIFTLALPWLIVRASIFNARNSSHRGLRFDFDGKVGDAVNVFLGLPVLTVLSLGIAAPYVSYRQRQFIVDHYKYGTTRFNLQATAGEFYSIYLKFLGVMLLIGAISAAAFFAMNKTGTTTALNSAQNAGQLNNQAAQPGVPAGQQSPAAPTGAQSASDAATATTPSADQVNPPSGPDQAATNPPVKPKIDPNLQKILKNPWIILGFLIPYLLFIFAIVSYFQARIGNLVWNTTTLDNLSFNSSLRFRDLLWIYLSNFALILMTFGLATPWAQVRTIKYRAGKLAITGAEDLDAFAGEKKAEAKAVGEEIADMFDIDISFG